MMEFDNEGGVYDNIDFSASPLTSPPRASRVVDSPLTTSSSSSSSSTSSPSSSSRRRSGWVPLRPLPMASPSEVGGSGAIPPRPSLQAQMMALGFEPTAILDFYEEEEAGLSCTHVATLLSRLNQALATRPKERQAVMTDPRMISVLRKAVALMPSMRPTTLAIVVHR